MSASLIALSAAGLLSGTVAGAAVAWVRDLAPASALAVLLGLVCATAAGLAARGTWVGARNQTAFFAAAAAALPVGLLI